MAYQVIANFAKGLDVRKSPVTSDPGTLQVMRNAFINAGGEIEKRCAFTEFVTLPAGTIGLGPGYVVGTTIGTAPAVFGTTPAPMGFPSTVMYQQLGTGSTLARIKQVETYDGKLYVVAETSLGAYEHFYDGALVTLPNDGIFHVIVHRNKVFGITPDTIFFSALNDPADWSGVGSGFIQPDKFDAGSWQLIGMSVYYDQLAIFARVGVQLWSMDEDPDKNQLVRTILNIGLVSPLASLRYGAGDVLFLHDSGIRSLRARDASNAAAVSDIGAPIDPLTRAHLIDNNRNNPAALQTVQTVSHPITGQAWFVWEGEIYVFTQAPSTNINAWSIFETPDSVDNVALVGTAVFLRSGNKLLRYGGEFGDEYDDTEAEAIVPFVAGEKPATAKSWFAMDAAIDGTWTFYAGSDTTALNVRDLVATITGASFDQQQVGMALNGTHVSVRAVTTSPTRARISSIVCHFNADAAT